MQDRKQRRVHDEGLRIPCKHREHRARGHLRGRSLEMLDDRLCSGEIYLLDEHRAPRGERVVGVLLGRVEFRVAHRLYHVDDSTDFRMVFSALLEGQLDLEVVGQAGSLAEARKMLEGVDVAILDRGLPDGDGLELLGPLREANLDARSS